MLRTMSSLCVQNFDLAPSSMPKGKPFISRPYKLLESPTNQSCTTFKMQDPLHHIPCPSHFDLEAYAPIIVNPVGEMEGVRGRGEDLTNFNIF